MSDPPAPRLVTVLTLVVGIPVLIWLAALRFAADAAREAMQGFGQALSLAALNATATIEAWSQMKAAADLVIEREQHGGYLLSGRLLREPLRAATIDEIEGIVRALPRRGAAFVTVEQRQALLTPITPDSARRQTEIEAVMRREGFAIVRGSYKVPLLPGPRPTPR